MGKILIAADIHFGLPQKLNDILWSVRTIREYAANNNIEAVIMCGDIFHDRVNYNIEVLNAAYGFFEETRRMGQEWIAFPGNHDMPLRHSWEVNTLKPLRDVLTVIEEVKLLKILGHRFWVVPFVHYESVYMKVLAHIEQQYEDGDVLLTHIGVNNATLNECFLIKHWSTVEFTESKFNRVFTGHFHCHQGVGERQNVWYPGSPIPFRFDEGMVPHGFIEFDLETQDIKFVKIFDLELIEGDRPPDYVTITDEMLEEDLSLLKNDCVRVQLARDYNRDELLRMRKTLEDHGITSIKLNKIKEEKINIDGGLKSGFSVSSPEELFNQWVEQDAPNKLDVSLLKKLNKQIVVNK